uniref:DB domain-containing protein n=1 Tax=Heterorhabditis bacteriophora TaxID=37862 RepID=A0A1I7XC05_HETBA
MSHCLDYTALDLPQGNLLYIYYFFLIYIIFLILASYFLIIAFFSKVSDACFASGVCGGGCAPPPPAPVCGGGGCGGGYACGHYGCYRTRARAASAKTLSIDERQVFSFLIYNILYLYRLAILYYFNTFFLKATTPDEKFMECCIDRKLPDSCLNKCSFRTYSKAALQAMYFKQDSCPMQAAADIHFCAAQGKDHRDCCSRNGVTTTLAGQKCITFCDQRPGNVTQLDFTYLACYDRFENMKACFWHDISENITPRVNFRVGGSSRTLKAKTFD